MSPTFLSRGIDHLGDLGAKLRHLQGFRPLAHELIQNADDLPAATSKAFDVDKDALIVDNNGLFSDCNRIDEAAIARELAGALFPDEDPGRFAAGLKVLASDTVAEAAASLDESCFARPGTAVREVAASGEAAGMLGTEAPAGAGEDTVTGPGLGQVVPTQQTPLSAEESLRWILGVNIPAPTPAVPNADAAEPARTVTTGPSRSAKQKGRPVLRSYLRSPHAADDAELVDDDGQGRSPVDEAGMTRALELETNCGRFPKEMPHKNPGYDIESCDTFDNVLGFIEVKPLSGRWWDTYAVLSRPQFDKAADLADRFWLYVVERAESDDFEIHPIQNPALKANRFMFDDGWRVTAEPPPVSGEGS